MKKTANDAVSALRRDWEAFARRDPMWAILTQRGREGRQWDPVEFFATGENEISELMSKAEALGLPHARDAALDFGCGVGRLTQALCRHFAHVSGVDIAPTMVEEAKRYNRFGDRCSYHQNERADLRLFPEAAFDLVYTNIVLQHIPWPQSEQYLREFVRVLRPGGLLVCQVPGRRRGVRGILSRGIAARMMLAISRIVQRPLMQMHGIPVATVRRTITAAGGTVLRVDEDDGCGPTWRNHWYWATCQ